MLRPEGRLRRWEACPSLSILLQWGGGGGAACLTACLASPRPSLHSLPCHSRLAGSTAVRVGALTCRQQDRPRPHGVARERPRQNGRRRDGSARGVGCRCLFRAPSWQTSLRKLTPGPRCCWPHPPLAPSLFPVCLSLTPLSRDRTHSRSPRPPYASRPLQGRPPRCLQVTQPHRRRGAWGGGPGAGKTTRGCGSRCSPRQVLAAQSVQGTGINMRQVPDHRYGSPGPGRPGSERPSNQDGRGPCCQPQLLSRAYGSGTWGTWVC